MYQIILNLSLNFWVKMTFFKMNQHHRPPGSFGIGMFQVGYLFGSNKKKR